MAIPRLALSELVREWCSALPNWISVRDPAEPLDPGLAKSLDAGEAAAIQLAGELKADFLLIDERLGRAEATRRGIPVVGALGVLREGFRRGFIADPMAVVAAMRTGGFRVSKRLLDEFQDGIEPIMPDAGSPP